MTRHLFLLTIIMLLTNFSFAQTDTTALNQAEWKNVVKIQAFKLTTNKYKIPLPILKQIGVDTISEITKNRFKWDASCAGREPSVKLNWAAASGQSWIICYTTGGYSIKTHYTFISVDTKLNQEISTGGNKFFKFKTFKQNFTSDKMFDPKTVRPLY